MHIHIQEINTEKKEKKGKKLKKFNRQKKNEMFFQNNK